MNVIRPTFRFLAKALYVANGISRGGVFVILFILLVPPFREWSLQHWYVFLAFAISLQWALHALLKRIQDERASAIDISKGTQEKLDALARQCPDLLEVRGVGVSEKRASE